MARSSSEYNGEHSEEIEEDADWEVEGEISGEQEETLDWDREVSSQKEPEENVGWELEGETSESKRETQIGTGWWTLWRTRGRRRLGIGWSGL
jgi:hypothetical protein